MTFQVQKSNRRAIIITKTKKDSKCIQKDVRNISLRKCFRDERCDPPSFPVKGRASQITIILIHLARAYTANVGTGRFLKNNKDIEREDDFYAFRDLSGFKGYKKG